MIQDAKAGDALELQNARGDVVLRFTVAAIRSGVVKLDIDLTGEVEKVKRIRPKKDCTARRVRRIIPPDGE